MSDRRADVTELLKRHTDGDPQALAELIPQVYNELHRLASCYLIGEEQTTRYRPLPWCTKPTFGW